MRFAVLRILGLVAVGVVAGWQLLVSDGVAATPVAALRINVLTVAGHPASVTVSNPNPVPMVLRRIDAVDTSSAACPASSVETGLSGLPRIVPAGGAVTIHAGRFLDASATCAHARVAVWAVAEPLQTTA